VATSLRLSPSTPFYKRKEQIYIGQVLGLFFLCFYVSSTHASLYVLKIKLSKQHLSSIPTQLYSFVKNSVLLVYGKIRSTINPLEHMLVLPSFILRRPVYVQCSYVHVATRIYAWVQCQLLLLLAINRAAWYRDNSVYIAACKVMEKN
jgi:hypothetical protein